jgi:hypothetical protein
MTLETSLIDSALRNWRSNVDRAGKLFGNLSQEQLLQEVAPGKNRLIYLWGHLTASNDALIPLLGFGPRIHLHPVPGLPLYCRKRLRRIHFDIRLDADSISVVLPDLR